MELGVFPFGSESRPERSKAQSKDGSRSQTETLSLDFEAIEVREGGSGV